jgi:hypothetical protein
MRDVVLALGKGRVLAEVACWASEPGSRLGAGRHLVGRGTWRSDRLGADLGAHTRRQMSAGDTARCGGWSAGDQEAAARRKTRRRRRLAAGGKPGGQEDLTDSIGWLG